MDENTTLMSLNTVVREDADGKPHIGIYWIHKDEVVLGYLGDLPTKRAVIGRSSAGGLAITMLREFMEDRK